MRAGRSPGGEWIAAWAWYGAPYALSLLLILLSHEMGHWFAARYYQVRASLPYFLPMPLTLVGTLGAFIRIRSPFPNRKALLDVGLAGPFAGFIVCLPVLALGVATSRSGPLEPGGLQFGEPLAFQFFAWAFGPAVPEGQALYLSPIGLAAWFGLLLTAINLLPMGQLDGGHALYAVFRRKALRISRSVHLLMFPLAILSPGWLVWGSPRTPAGSPPAPSPDAERRRAAAGEPGPPRLGGARDVRGLLHARTGRDGLVDPSGRVSRLPAPDVGTAPAGGGSAAIRLGVPPESARRGADP